LTRQRDLSFEKLTEVSGQTLATLNSYERGALNKALSLIRESCEGMEDAEVAMVIEAKARTYRKLWPEISITPMALAMHWSKLDGLLEQQQEPTTYVSSDRSICTTCEGLRFVFAHHRPPFLTTWMIEVSKHKKAKAPAPWLTDPKLYLPDRHGSEVFAACPDCNPVGAGKVEEYLSRFNQRHSGGPRLPVPATIQAFAPNTEEL
jgi:hypothetical protein